MQGDYILQPPGWWDQCCDAQCVASWHHAHYVLHPPGSRYTIPCAPAKHHWCQGASMATIQKTLDAETTNVHETKATAMLPLTPSGNCCTRRWSTHNHVFLAPKCYCVACTELWTSGNMVDGVEKIDGGTLAAVVAMGRLFTPHNHCLVAPTSASPICHLCTYSCHHSIGQIALPLAVGRGRLHCNGDYLEGSQHVHGHVKKKILSSGLVPGKWSSYWTCQILFAGNGDNNIFLQTP